MVTSPVDRRLVWIYRISLVSGLIYRLAVSLTTYSIRHPDEIFQSLEMAHVMVYDSGHVPAEFRSSNPVDPSYAASRAWIFPLVFAGLMQLGEFLQLDYWTGTLVLIRVYMAFHSTLLIPVVKRLSWQLTKNHKSAVFSAVVISFWYPIIEYTTRTFSNTFFLPFLFYGLYNLLQGQDEGFTFKHMILSGMLVGLATYVRLDQLVIVLGFFVAYGQRQRWRQYSAIACVGLISWLLLAYLDYFMYETAPFFSVPINWFTFNFIEGKSADFGVTGPFTYIGLLIFEDLLFPWFFLVLLWPVLHYWRPSRVLGTPLGQSFLNLWKASLIIWWIYSNLWFTFNLHPFSIALAITHKEERFLIGGLIIFLITSCIASQLLVQYLASAMSRRHLPSSDPEIIDFSVKLYQQRLWSLIISLFLVACVLTASIQSSFDRNEGINHSLIYIGQQGNAQAITVSEHYFLTGHTTYAHVNSTVVMNFWPVDESSHNEGYFMDLVRQRPDHHYLVIQPQVFDIAPQLEHLLDIFNWTSPYSYDGTEVWVYIST